MFTTRTKAQSWVDSTGEKDRFVVTFYMEGAMKAFNSLGHKITVALLFCGIHPSSLAEPLSLEQRKVYSRALQNRANDPELEVLSKPFREVFQHLHSDGDSFYKTFEAAFHSAQLAALELNNRVKNKKVATSEGSPTRSSALIKCANQLGATTPLLAKSNATIDRASGKLLPNTSHFSIPKGTALLEEDRISLFSGQTVLSVANPPYQHTGSAKQLPINLRKLIQTMTEKARTNLPTEKKPEHMVRQECVRYNKATQKMTFLVPSADNQIFELSYRVENGKLSRAPEASVIHGTLRGWQCNYPSSKKVSQATLEDLKKKIEEKVAQLSVANPAQEAQIQLTDFHEALKKSPTNVNLRKTQLLKVLRSLHRLAKSTEMPRHNLKNFEFCASQLTPYAPALTNELLNQTAWLKSESERNTQTFSNLLNANKPKPDGTK